MRLAPSVLCSAIIGFFGAALVISAGRELSFDSAHMKGYLLALCCRRIWSSFSVGLPGLKLNKEPMAGFTVLAIIRPAFLYIAGWPRQMHQ